MRLTSSGAYARSRPAPKMPPGLVELMEDLTRNVLRHNPTDIYEFCAGHMQRLLEIRDGGAPKPVLTLEQKIARAQEKLNKKAEMRRQKYDKQMQLYRLNNKTEQSPEPKDHMEPSNVENKPTNSLETHSSEVADTAKQIVTVNPVENKTHSDIVEDKPDESTEMSPEQDLRTINNEEEIETDLAEDTKIKPVETNSIQDLDTNIEPDAKDSIEKHLEIDLEDPNISKESVTDGVMQRKAEYSEEIKNELGDLTELPVEQDIELHNKEEESSNIEDNVVGDQTNDPLEEQSVKDIKIENGSEQLLAAKVQDENSHIDVLESNIEDSTAILQEVTELSKAEKESKEKQFVRDIEMENGTEESVAAALQDKTSHVDVVEGNIEDTTAILQDVTELSKAEKEPKEEQFVRDIEMGNGTEESVAAALQDETSHIDVVEGNIEDLTAVLQEVTKLTKAEEESSGENIEADNAAFSNIVEDKSKGPIHHEQDLVDDLEVEIFHELSEAKKESNKDSSDIQATIDEVNLQNIESDVANVEGSEESKRTKDNNSFEKHYLDTESGENLILESRSQEDKSKVTEENLSKNTNTSNKNSEIDNSNSTINLDTDIIVPETINVDSKISVHENTTQINEVTELSSPYKTENITTKVSSVDKKEQDEKRVIMSEKVDQCEDEKINETFENIENNVVVKDNVNKKHILDVNGKSLSDGGVSEIPMQKKEYALLLPEVNSDNKTEPIALEHENGQLKDEMQEDNVTSAKNYESFIDKNELNNIDKSEKNSLNEDKNIVKRIEHSSGDIKETVDNALESCEDKSEKNSLNEDKNIVKRIEHSSGDIKETIDNALESCEDISKPLEKNENVTDDYIKSKLIDDVRDDTMEVKECNANGKDKDKALELESYDKQTEMKTLISGIEITNNNTKLDSESTKQDERSGDAEENVSVNSELTQNTETQVINDSADNSTIEDSNDSLMDRDVEAMTRSEDINKSPSTMDLETAAVTIQKVFRTFLFKSRCSTFDDTSNDEANPTTDDDDNEKEEVEFPIAKERRALGISRMDTVLQTVNEEKSLSLSTDDSSTLSSAATVIQAHVRGYLARNKFYSHRNTFSTSLVNSDVPSTHSLEADDQQKKTVLNIHIVPEGDHFLSRDESVITSMDLSLDGSPPTSINLHPLGYDKSEPRKQLKREDAIQSISPPSNNSGKLSEDVESVKDVVINETTDTNISRADTDADSDTSPTKSTTLVTVIETVKGVEELSGSLESELGLKDPQCKRTLTKMSSDESDVVTPFEQDKESSADSDNTSHLLHSGEFHDMVLPTKVSRGDTSVVRGE